jgi:pimeloyl-ACP methyl ester carboxylesterase
MFDDERITAVDAKRVRCPVLVVTSAQDKVVSASTGRHIAELYGERATFHEAAGHGHFLLLEAGWERLAQLCVDWLEQILAAAMRSGND